VTELAGFEGTVEALSQNGAECAIFGSSVTGERWPGSDLNLLVVEDGDERVTSTATNYVFGDWSLDTPAITKVLVGGELFQTEVYPSATLDGALEDWVLCDRLYHARLVTPSRGALAAAIEAARRRRFDGDVRRRRVAWYRTTSESLVAHADDPMERAFALRVAALLFGCAELELRRDTKRSYKRLYRQCEAAYADASARADFVRLSAVADDARGRLSSLVPAGLAAMERIRSFYLDEARPYVAAAPPGLRESFRTTLAISADGVPAGKGILENVALEDYPAALDCLRKATLWLGNAALRMEGAVTGTFPRSGRFLATLLDLPVMTDEIARLVVEVFALEDAAPDDSLRAFRRLAARLAEAESALAHE
jgi:hypothetical protein